MTVFNQIQSDSIGFVRFNQVRSDFVRFDKNTIHIIHKSSLLTSVAVNGVAPYKKVHNKQKKGLRGTDLN